VQRFGRWLLLPVDRVLQSSCARPADSGMVAAGCRPDGIGLVERRIMSCLTLLSIRALVSLREPKDELRRIYMNGVPGVLVEARD
jgi:hypothetical protein